MRDQLRRALEWCGFTPTAREAHLHRRLLQAAELATEQRLIVGRVEVLLRYREQLGAKSIDVESLHEALFGEGEVR